MIKYIYIFNTDGRPRIVRFYDGPKDPARLVIQNEVTKLCLAQSNKKEGILDYTDHIVVYRYYGNLVFTAGITDDENELAIMEFLQNFVETMMKYFNKISEADIILYMDKVYMILDEMIMGGNLAETNQARILAPLQLRDLERK